MSQMQRMLRAIQDEYEYPVDTEFTINVSDSGEYSVDLLQCRPLQVLKDKTGVTVRGFCGNLLFLLFRRLWIN